MRIAIIGSGIAGMTAAHVLRREHEVRLFETEGRPGGHANTVPVDVPEGTVAADTGFLVYNERTYPNICRLLDQLGVATEPSDMSFSVTDVRAGVQWRGTSVSTVFAQRRNALRPEFLAMLADVARFNRLAKGVLREPASHPGSLAELLGQRRWSRRFLDWYLIPLGSAIWSADPETFTRIPAVTFAEFFGRHGLLGPGDQPAWRTITGGSHTYVRAITEPLRRQGRLHLATGVGKVRRLAEGVELLTDDGPALFDHVVVAAHSDQALELLGDPTPMEQAVLGSIRYQPNRATLHTDGRLLPSNRRARASWNYVLPPQPSRVATLTYGLNTLQNLATDTPVLVTLNGDESIDPAKVVASFDYAHPVIDEEAVAVQRHQLEIGGDTVSFCGAYWGHGFHEDGVRSALAVCRRRFGLTL